MNHRPIVSFKLWLLVSLSVLLIPIFEQASATRIRVPADFTTIQAAIDASTSGDTVYVSPGTYVENINFLGKNILLKSTNGAAQTRIVHAGGAVAAVSIVQGETREAVIDGFTISDIQSFSGIAILDSDPIVRNCRIEFASSIGIQAINSSSLIEDNEINRCGYGVEANGGPHMPAEIARNRISIAGILGMRLRSDGGTLYAHSNVIDSCEGGVSLSEAYEHPLIFNYNMITHTEGTAMSLESGSRFSVSNNTVVGAGYGILIVDQSVGDVLGDGNLISEIQYIALADINRYLNRTLLWNESGSISYPITPKSKYLVADPRFVSAVTGDYSLLCDSPAIDNGDPSLTDPDGSRSDIGALPFDHFANAPIAMNLELVGEVPFQVISQNPTFAWTPVTSKIVHLDVDTIICFEDPLGSGNLTCFADTTIFETVSPQLAFELEVGTDDDWSVAELMASGEIQSADTTIGYSGAPLAQGQNCYVRLRLREEIGWGCWRQLGFRRNAIPAPPVHSHPINSARVAASDVKLAVTSLADAELETTYATLEVSNDASFSVVNFDTSIVRTGSVAVTASIPDLVAGTAYWWRARSCDTHECSEWSTPTTFTAWSTRSFRVPEDFVSIESAILWAADGDTIFVGPGIYQSALQLRKKALTLIGTGGPDHTVFSSAGFKIWDFALAPKMTSIQGFHFDQAHKVVESDGPVTISNCRFTRSASSSIFRPVLQISSSLTVDSCVFDGTGGFVVGGYLTSETPVTITNSRFDLEVIDQYTNTAKVWLNSADGTPYQALIHNNLFLGEGFDEAIRLNGPVDGSIENNVFASYQQAVSVDTVNSVVIQNNQFVDNTGYAVESNSDLNNYNNFWNNALNYSNSPSGPNDISVDPLFVDPAHGDYRLQCSSLCIDAGNPATPGYKGKAIDIGAFEFDYVVGNANGNLTGNPINLTDVVFLVNYIFGGGSAPCPFGAGLVDCDEITSIADVVYLINYLYVHGPAPDVGCP